VGKHYSPYSFHNKCYKRVFQSSKTNENRKWHVFKFHFNIGKEAKSGTVTFIKTDKKEYYLLFGVKAAS
jgi:hypothetical protein